MHKITNAQVGRRGAGAAANADDSRQLVAAWQDQAQIAAFEAVYANWREAQSAIEDPAYDDSEEMTDRLCDALSAAESELCAAMTPTKQQLRYKFEHLEASREAGNDRDVGAVLASIKVDLKRWGFDLPNRMAAVTFDPN